MTTSRVSLEESQTLERLHQEVTNITHLDKRDLLALMDLINAPANLRLLFHILKDLPPILDKAKAIQQIATDNSPEIDFDRAIETCDLLLHVKPQIEACEVLGGLFPDDNKSEWQQLVGILGSNPLYSCLCFRPNDPSFTESYLQLLAHMLVASQVYRKLGNDLSDLDNGFRAVRKLSNKNSEKELQTLPTRLTPVSDYMASVAGANTDSLTASVGKLLEHAYHGRKSKEWHRRGTKREPLERLKTAIEELDDYENPANLWTGNDFIPRGVLSDKESEEYAKHGGSAAEFTGGQDDVPIPAVDERVITPPTLAELNFQGKQRSNQEALKNQLNPLGWNELNQFDVFVLCRYLNESGVKQEPHDVVARDCLNLMFWLSAPPERILTLRKYRGTPWQGSPEGLYLKENRVIIARLHSPGPQLTTQEFSSFSDQAYEVKHHCNIPLPTIAHTKSLLKECRASVPVKTAVTEDITEPDEEYIDFVARTIRGALAKLNSEFGTRLTPGRISHYWLHALAREQKLDLPSSMLFFGQSPEYSVARMHYTCASAQHLEESYRNICTETLRELGFSNAFPDGDSVNDHIYLGTPFCPTADAVSSLAMSLRNAIDQSRPLHNELKYVMNFHNSYALYTACMIAFATTYRAVRDPSLYEKDIHYTSGLGVISDKDDEACYHSRLVWISDECRKQIAYYRRHLQRLYELFSLESPPLSRLFKNLVQEGRPLNLFIFQNENVNKDKQSSAENAAPHKTPKIVLEELKPANIEVRLREYHKYFLPANANRHYLKNELLNSGCPGDVVEAQMGHWDQGQEPWIRFSNLHPREFVRQLKKHLAPILKRDGWVAIAGCDQ